MTLATFTPPIPPSFSGQNTPTVKVIKAEFGDGYSQRTRDGINSVSDSWSLAWDYLTPTDATTVNDFFKSKAGADAFLWTAPAKSTAQKWICNKWARTRVAFGQDKITATFTEVFDL